MDDVTALRDRVARLEAQLAELRDLVDRSHAGGFRSIRDTRRCPACGGGAFLHAPRTTQASHTQVVPFGIAHHWKWTGAVASGVMEVFACRHCGLVEWHVIAPADVEPDGVNVLAVEPESDPPRDGPFR